VNVASEHRFPEQTSSLLVSCAVPMHVDPPVQMRITVSPVQLPSAVQGVQVPHVATQPTVTLAPGVQKNVPAFVQLQSLAVPVVAVVQGEVTPVDVTHDPAVHVVPAAQT
jgi:hypothetical protein